MPQHRKNALAEIGEQWIARDHPDKPMLYRFWTEPGTGRTRRKSLGTTDLASATRALAVIVVKGEPKTVDTLLSDVLVKYFEEKTDRLSSKKVARGHGKKVLAFVGNNALVRSFTEDKQKKFVEHCLEKGHKLAYVARVMATVAAALHHCKLTQPEIISTEAKMVDKWHFESTEPKKAYMPTDKEWAELILAERATVKLWRWAIIQCFTSGRPQTAVDLAPAQFNKEAGVVALNPPGRAQVKRKYRATVKAARTFRLLLRAWERQGLDDFGGTYCGYTSIEGPKSAIQRLAAETGIPISLYSFRHKGTSVMRSGRVPEDQVSQTLGHRRVNLRITAGYGEYAPDYQAEAAAAFENWFWRIVKLARKLAAERANSQPTPEIVRTRTTRAA